MILQAQLELLNLVRKMRKYFFLKKFCGTFFSRKLFGFVPFDLRRNILLLFVWCKSRMCHSWQWSVTMFSFIITVDDLINGLGKRSTWVFHWRAPEEWYHLHTAIWRFFGVGNWLCYWCFKSSWRRRERKGES